MDINSLAHTKWNCKYHIVFAPKYRRQVIYGKIRTDIGKILRLLCQRKVIEIIEAELCKDHIHMLVEIPPKYSISGFMGFLKGKSSLMIYEKWGNMKYKYRRVIGHFVLILIPMKLDIVWLHRYFILFLRR